jgi:glutathione S-transferase
MAEARRVLYRCGTPTNYLCPCGAVARRLNKLGVEYRTERVRRRRSSRPEIIELTGLPYVPVLVDGDEVVNDSHRIREYLDWKYGEDAQAGEDQGAQAGNVPKSGERPSTIHLDE